MRLRRRRKPCDEKMWPLETGWLRPTRAYSEPREATRICCGPCVPPAEVQMKVRSRTIAFCALALFCAHTLTTASASLSKAGEGGRESDKLRWTLIPESLAPLHGRRSDCAPVSLPLPVPLNHLRLWLTLTGRECHVSGLSRGSSTPGHRVSCQASSNQSIISHSLSYRAYSRPCFGTRARIVPEIIASPLLLSPLGWPPPPLGTLRHRNLPFDFSA